MKKTKLRIDGSNIKRLPFYSEEESELVTTTQCLECNNDIEVKALYEYGIYLFAQPCSNCGAEFEVLEDDTKVKTKIFLEIKIGKIKLEKY